MRPETTVRFTSRIAARCLLAVPVAALAIAGCGVDEQVHNAALKDLAEQKQKLAATQGQADKDRAECKTQTSSRDDRIAQLEQQKDALGKRLEALGQDMSRLQTERGSLEAGTKTLEADLAQARKRMEELRKAQAQAEARAAQFRQLVTRFKQLTDSGKLQVEMRENRMIVRLGDQILFDPGKTALKKEGQDALHLVTSVLKEIPNRNYQVAGHTDNVPIKSKKFDSNWDLSTARAVEVVKFMLAEGMEGKRLSAAGYGDMSPVAPNDTPENMAKNRRIEITLVPNLDDLPPLDEALKDAPGVTVETK